jgi:hypothetical protein
MIPSAMGQLDLRLELQLLKIPATAITTTNAKNNFFIVFL